MGLAGRIKLGMAIPQTFIETPVDMTVVRRVSQRAEELGFESLWTSEGTFSSRPNLEPVGLLNYVAGLTSTARLGVSVLIFPLHSPVRLAKAFASLDQMSNGRAILGIGLGERSAPFGAFGLTPAKRVQRFEEGIQIMKALWTQASTEYHSEMYQLEGAHIEPKPVQRPHLPIWLGGSHPNVLARAVKMADGWMGAGASSNSEFKQRVVEIRQLLDKAGRDPEKFSISKRIYISVDSNEDRALDGLRQWFGATYNSPGGASDVAVWGSPKKCAEILEEVASVGVDHLLLNPVHAFEEQLEAVAEIASLK